MGKRYYDNYDYEEAYKEQCKKLEEAEMERWMKRGVGKLPIQNIHIQKHQYREQHNIA